MIRKWLAVGIILLFVGIAYSPAIAQNKEKPLPTFYGKWLYVGGDGPGNYSKIQDAINDSHYGDTIFVYNGRYYEHAIIISKQINLIGENRNNTILDGQGKYTDGIHVGNGVNVHGLTIEGFTQYDMTLGSGTGVYIEGNNIKISDCIITNCTHGLFVRQNAYQIEISNNIFSQTSYFGLYLQATACSVHDNYFKYNHYALDVMKGSRLVSIDHNQFELNWVGIWARSTRANISCNNFIDNSGYHVYLEWDSRLLMLPFVFYWKPVFSENYWDDWTDVSPRPINGHFVLWLKIGDLSIMLYVSDIVQYDQHPAQEPYDIGG